MSRNVVTKDCPARSEKAHQHAHQPQTLLGVLRLYWKATT